MKAVKKNVYYCDHCSKKGLVAMHIRNHEARCTNNPNRYCGVCGEADTARHVIASLLTRITLAENPSAYDPKEPIYDPAVNTDEKIVTWVGEPVTLQEIKRLVDDCPACTLAVLRQTGLNRHYFHLEKFDFKTELAAWLAINNMPHNPYNL